MTTKSSVFEQSSLRELRGGAVVRTGHHPGRLTIAPGATYALPVRKGRAVLPGCIRTDLNATAKRTQLIIDSENGCRLLAKAIEREPGRAVVPAWPWGPIGIAMRLLPLSIVAKLS
jgi:hypothetical protein